MRFVIVAASRLMWKFVSWTRARLDSVRRSISGSREGRVALLFALLTFYGLYYAYNRLDFNVWIAYVALAVAALAAFVNVLSLKWTRDTVRPFLSFKGTINLGSATLAFPITNTGSMPASNVTVRIDPFGKDENIDIENVSRTHRRFFDEPEEAPQPSLSLFPSQTWQHVVVADLTQEKQKELWENLITGKVKIRVTISYGSFGRKHKTIQTLAFDKFSLQADGKEFHGISIEPQAWI